MLAVGDGAMLYRDVLAQAGPHVEFATPSSAHPDGAALGRCGGAIKGACLSALSHPLPSVPLVAAIGVELVVQLGLVVVARVAGVGGAVLARATATSIVYRFAYPAGAAWDGAALAAVALGALLIVLRRERE